MDDLLVVFQSLALGYVGVAIVPASIRKHGVKANPLLLAVFFAFASFAAATYYTRIDLTELLFRSAIFGLIPIAAGYIVYRLTRGSR